MFQTLLITFREGLEALLIVAIAATVLRRTGRESLVRALRAGTLTAVLGSIALGIVLSRIGALSSTWEGTMALLAAVAVMTCTVHMLRMGKRMKHEITAQLDRAAPSEGAQAWWGTFAFAVFMVGREGVETATILASLAGNAELRHLALGGVAGLLLAAAIAWAWVKQGHKVNLARFFQVTSIFMVLFSMQLVVYAFHEYTEAGVVPGIDNAAWHIATEDLAEGNIAQAISMSLVMVPMLWLALAWWLDRRPAALDQPSLPVAKS